MIRLKVQTLFTTFSSKSSHSGCSAFIFPGQCGYYETEIEVGSSNTETHDAFDFYHISVSSIKHNM